MNTTRRSHLRLLLASATLALLSNSVISSTKNIMDEQIFWELVDAAKAAAGPNHDSRPAQLELRLTPLDLVALGAFQRRYEAYLLRANRWDLWGAAYLMNGGCSDDGFKYFRDWLISEGRDVYEGALADPESLAAFPRREYFELESFGYAASKAFARKGGGELQRDFNVELAAPAGKEWKESDLSAMFPKLAAKYLSK
jgi:hypothetical protein